MYNHGNVVYVGMRRIRGRCSHVKVETLTKIAGSVNIFA